MKNLLRPAFFALLVGAGALVFTSAFEVPSADAKSPRGRKGRKKKKDDEDDKKKEQEEKVDHIALAGLLLKDGHLERAKIELDQVDLSEEGIDKVKYWLLRGLIEMRGNDLATAAGHFEKSVAEGNADPLIHVFLTQCYYAAEAWEKTLAALDAAGPTMLDKYPKLFQVRIQAYWKLDRLAEAYEALVAAAKLRPEMAGELGRQKVMLLIEMGLFTKAADEGRKHLAQFGESPDDHVAMAEAMRRAGQLEDVILFMEQAHLTWPDNEQVLLQLGRAYVDAKKPLAAGALFEMAAVKSPERAEEAAELFRRAGQLQRALFLNGRIPDQKKKIRQRMALLTELGRFESAAAMEPRMRRLGLMRDDSILYALAYAYFQTGRMDEASRVLKRIRSADMFERSADLRRAMEACKADRSNCP